LTWRKKQDNNFVALSMNNFPQRRLVAALLPAFFLWAFVACISICERDTVNLVRSGPSSSTVGIREVSGVFDCAACPLSFFPKATALEKTQIAFNSESSSLPFESQRPGYSDRILVDKSLTNPPGTESPPLDLLSALRI
jgi:hypothetical protein